MTSEIVIMTSNAIAMAADSALTVRESKIYDGANKLFMLSNNPPVGIMFYNKNSFLNIHFETIVKEFRKSIKDQYNYHFFNKFLKKNNSISTILDFQSCLVDYFRVLVGKSEFKNSFESQLKSYLEKLPEIINSNPNFYENILNLNIIEENLFNAVYNEIDENYLNQYQEVASQIESNLNIPHDKDIFIKNFINFSIIEMFVNNHTGVVLAGFNQDSLFPSCTAFKICYLYDDKYIICDFKHSEVSPVNGDVIINMFAQHDVINTFLRSIDPNTKVRILNYYNKNHEEYLTKILEIVNTNDNIDEDVKQDIINDIIYYDNSKNIYGGLLNTISEIEIEHYGPMLESIGALP